MWHIKYRRYGEKGKLNQRALLRAGGAQVKDFAGKGAEIFRPAFRIGALDPGDALLVVPAVQEPLHRFDDALKAERSQALGELGLMAGDELR